MGKKEKKGRENDKGLSHLDLDTVNAASSTDFTGLIPAKPQSEEELESYGAVYEIHNDDAKGKKQREKRG